MTELEYLLLADSVYLDLKMDENKTIRDGVNETAYKDRNIFIERTIYVFRTKIPRND